MDKYVKLVEQTLNESTDKLKDGSVVKVLDDRVMGKKSVGKFFKIIHFKDKYIFKLSDKNGKELKPKAGVGGALNKSEINSYWDNYKSQLQINEETLTEKVDVLKHVRSLSGSTIGNITGLQKYDDQDKFIGKVIDFAGNSKKEYSTHVDLLKAFFRANKFKLSKVGAIKSSYDVERLKKLVNEETLTESKEYVIWGIMPNHKEESLLLAKPNGKAITNKSHANKFKEWCEKKGATKVRIQEVDLLDNDIDFVKGVK